jgi:hypothetical protein
MRFETFFAARGAPGRNFVALPANASPLGRVNDAPTQRRILDRSGTGDRGFHHFKTTARIASARGQTPLSGVAAPWP